MIHTSFGMKAKSQVLECEKRIDDFFKASTIEGDPIQWWDSPPMVKGGEKAIARTIHYPDSALAAGIEGRVWMLMFLDKNNKPECVTIRRSENAVFNAESLKVISNLEYEPATIRGKAIYNVILPVVINFDIEEYKKNQKRKRKK